MSAERDIRSDAAADRLLEQTWRQRRRRLPRRELLSELVASALFAAAACVLLWLGGVPGGFDPAVAAGLLAIYVILAAIEFPVGAGNVLPTQLALMPMLVLLPPAAVPPLVAAALLAARLLDWLRGRGSLDRLLFSVPDAWHAIGPAVVLVAAGAQRLDPADIPLVLTALLACCVFDAGTATLREAASRGVAPTLQLRAFATVWLVDACLAPVGLLAADGARHHIAAVLLVLPLAGLLLLLARDRSRRIEQAQHRLEVAVRERGRLQLAVRRMGDAFAAKLDSGAILDIMLRGSIDALDGDAGALQLREQDARRLPAGAPDDLQAFVDAAAAAAIATGEAARAGCALALPFSVPGAEVHSGAVAVARRDRPFQPDEITLLEELVAKAQTAIGEIAGHQALREAVSRDPLTGLGNRRKLSADLGAGLPGAGDRPRLFMLFDLNGFKGYNDTFGHLAGDALLSRLGAKLSAAVEPHGDAYRLGGDEFCAVLDVDADRVAEIIAGAAQALSETGEELSVTAAYGAVLLPHEADTLERALQLADERMYSHKRGRAADAGEQTHDVLMRILHARQPALRDHASGVAELAVAVARRFGMTLEEIDELGRAAELHDIGKVGIPDAVLDKPGPLDAADWDFMRQHTLLGERILNAAETLRPVARIVRSTHERWDGTGYPDRLTATEIPAGARIIAVCDAYAAMTAGRPYRPALTHDDACQELRAHAGTQFDPEVVDLFLDQAAARPPVAPSDSEGLTPASDIAEHLRTLLATATP